ncbi:MAG: hypothetical protein JJU13_17025 [Balneolaceae bacterium]|nr:hypothetical protein [Balneolaceae bacterium]
MISAFIQGINPVVPIIVIVLLSSISFFVAWWTYYYLDSIPSLRKNALILLRGSTLLILLLLLLNPFLSIQEIISERPAVAVYLDNSQSISVERGDYEGLNTFREIISRFESERNDDLDYDYFLFDETVTASDELDATGVRTNINEVMEYIRENENRYRASLFFSDGIVTQGRNPIFSAQNLSTPIITVPIGDTTEVRDIAVANVDYIQQIYTYTRQTIRAEIQQQGFEGEDATVQFIRDGEVIETETLEFTTSPTSQTVEFSQEFEEPGFYDFEINVPPKPDEFTDQNNRAAFTIEVLDDKTRILSFAFEVHPDVSTIRRLIATDQQNELISSTYLGNNRFTGGDPRQLDEEPDLIVLHGLPPVQSDLFEWIYDQQTPILFVATPGSFQYLTDNDVTDLTSYYIQSPGEVIDIQLENFTGGISHPLLEVSMANFQRFPSLQTYRGDYRLSAIAQQLTSALFQRNETDIPVLIAEDATARRIASVNAFGWYRFEQNSQEEVRNFFTEFFTNLVSWSATPPDRQMLTLEPAKSSFTENESVEVRANLFNERGDPEPEGFIELEIFSGDDEESLNVFRMNHQQNEVYTAELGNYPQGMYRVRAEATKNGRNIGTAEARVNVSQSSIEFLNTKRDDDMLHSLAEITDGIFLDDFDFNRFNEFMAELLLEQPDEEIREDFFYLYRSVFWFIVVIVLLSAEWLIRRSVSLP